MTGKRLLLLLATAVFVFGLHLGGGDQRDNSSTPVVRSANPVSIAVSQSRQQPNIACHELRFRHIRLFRPESVFKYATLSSTAVAADYIRQSWHKAQWGWD